MGTAVLVGVFSLLGVIVGGVLNGLVSAGLEHVREARRAMVTARLVRSDLLYVEATLRAEIEEGIWKRITANEPRPSFESWKEGREWLGASLGLKQWALVEIAARQAMRVVLMAPTNPKPGQSINAAERANMEEMLPDLAAGATALRPLAHGEGVPGLWRAMLPRGARRLEPPEQRDRLLDVFGAVERDSKRDDGVDGLGSGAVKPPAAPSRLRAQPATGLPAEVAAMPEVKAAEAPGAGARIVESEPAPLSSP